MTLSKLIEQLESATQNKSGMFELGEDTMCAVMALALRERAEPQRNPVLTYADSYRDMARRGVESIPVWSVITDLERNIAPLYTAQPAPVVPDFDELEKVLRWIEQLPVPTTSAAANYRRLRSVIDACRAAMLHDAEPVSQPHKLPSGWIKCSERMPELNQEVLCIDRYGGYEAALYTKGYFNNTTAYFAVTSGEFHPTHWQPLPPAPGKEG